MKDSLVAQSDARKPGRAKGGTARAKALPALTRSAIGKKGAAARWSPDIRTASYGDAAHPLILGDAQIDCYVLDNEERVLSQRGFLAALGLRSSGGAMERFIKHANLEPYLSPDALEEIRNPLKMRQPRGGPLAYSYRGPLLIDVCNALLSSYEHGVIDKPYDEAVTRAYVIVRAVAKVGIIALIDEATGYEKQRAADSLAQILEAFIAKELQPWIKTFPTEFYSELFRLRGLAFPDGTVRPSYFGHLTNDIVYRRLSPGVLDELKRVAPKNAKGRRTNKLFQMLTLNLGYRKLIEHLGAVVTMMQLSKNYADFKVKLDRLRPTFGSTIPLPFDEEDTGTGI